MRATWRLPLLVRLSTPALQLLIATAAVSLLSLAAAAYGQPATAFGTVRVLLATEQQQVEVEAAGAHSGYVDGVRRFTTAASLSWPLTMADGELRGDGSAIGKTLLIRMDSGLLEFGGRRYRGALRLSATTEGIEVVNVLDIESYLRGVVPSEMAASWPLEALKAQAVAARSYTLTSLDPSARYDLCATDECQVYKGVATEHPRSDAAIAATAGIVVSYQGATARTYYHADSGGMIASSQEVWGGALPYLVARADAPTSTPHRAWVYRLDAAIVGASMNAAGVGVGTVQGLRVIRLSESGRVVELQVNGTNGSQVLRGSQLTGMARGWGLRSTRFTVQSGLTVRGDGWGHGVGMSQYGARALALAGAQVREGLSLAHEAGIERLATMDRPRSVLVAATGGSAIVAEVLELLAEPGSPVPVQAPYHPLNSLSSPAVAVRMRPRRPMRARAVISNVRCVTLAPRGSIFRISPLRWPTSSITRPSPPAPASSDPTAPA